MTAFKSDFLNVLQERGFVHQCSNFEGLDALAARGEATAYVGYDCTAPSLHIGNYLTLVMLYGLQQSGNKPITLMGAAPPWSAIPPGRTNRARCAVLRRSKPTKRASAACSPGGCVMPRAQPRRHSP